MHGRESVNRTRGNEMNVIGCGSVMPMRDVNVIRSEKRHENDDEAVGERTHAMFEYRGYEYR